VTCGSAESSARSLVALDVLTCAFVARFVKDRRSFDPLTCGFVRRIARRAARSSLVATL
jgi:hypothetical protein